MKEIDKLRNKTLKKMLRIIDKRASMGECNYVGEVSDWLADKLNKMGFQIEVEGYTGIYKKVTW